MQSRTSRGSLRRGLISVFVCFHIIALLWWNVGVMDYAPEPKPNDVWSKMRAAVATVDPSGAVRGTLREYVRATSLWQLWIMFPNGPRDTSMLEIRGVLAYAADGTPTYDPVPIRSVHELDVLDYGQRIGLFPCGWRRDQTPLWTHVRKAYAHYHAEEAQRRRGTHYAGLEFICYLRELPAPGKADAPEAEWKQLVLWSGPLDANWRSL